MNVNEFKQKHQSIFNRSLNKKRKCMIYGCNELAIKSHTLQKNGILKEISYKNHLYQFSNTSPFEIEKKGRNELKRIGINNVYTFPGYCKTHDTTIFKDIETDNFDVKSKKSIKLFSYRALCQEIRRKEIALDATIEMLIQCESIMMHIFYKDLQNKLENGIKNLNFFKSELEKDIQDSEENNFDYGICEIPKLEVCISAPLNIYDPKNKLSYIENEKGTVEKIVTSIFNIFPLKDKSYAMLANHKKYHCNWSENTFSTLKKDIGKNYEKIVSDFITTRVEFWCISQKLKDSIGNEKIKILFEKWQEEASNFNSQIENKINIFR